MCISNIIIAFIFKERKAWTCTSVTLDKKKFTVKLFKKMSPEMGPKWLEMVWNIKKTYLENEFFFWKFFEKCDFWMISCIFEPHMHHEIMRYSPISLWMRKIRLRDIVNVYHKHNYCIQFQRKKGMNMRNRHFGLWQNLKNVRKMWFLPFSSLIETMK